MMNSQSQFPIILIVCGFLAVVVVETASQRLNISKNQVHRQFPPPIPRGDPRVQSCPPQWIESLLKPCHCDPSAPARLQCSGPEVTSEELVLMEYRLRFLLKYLPASGQQEKGNQLQEGLSQFDTLLLTNTALTTLERPLFHLFPLDNVVLDSDNLLKQIHLVSAFGHREANRKIVHLDNLFIINMRDVSIDE